jgi:ATP-dependent helicase/nuclease subunit B
MEAAHPGEEAQAVALLIRQALEEPERRVALITSDRGLAARVVAHLKRWDVQADDTAGLPLPQTAAGRVLLLLAELASSAASPVPLLALLTHPLVGAGEGRAAWLENGRALDLELRGPRPTPGFGPIRLAIAKLAKRGRGEDIAAWWDSVETILAPLLDLPEDLPLAEALDLLSTASEALCSVSGCGKAQRAAHSPPG